MLKIRDDVKLKELEKYGFVQNKFIKEVYYTKEKYNADDENKYFDDYNIEFIVNPNGKKCKNEIIGCFNAEEDAIDESFNLDILYDLIKDGLVEKVEVKE